MKYIQLDKDRWVEVNEETNSSRVIVKSELISQIKDIELRITDSIQPTDKDLLAWAKNNYPYVDHSIEQQEWEKLSSLLENLK